MPHGRGKNSQPPVEEPSLFPSFNSQSQLGGRQGTILYPEVPDENATRGGRRCRTGKRRTGKQRSVKRRTGKRKSMHRRR